MAATQCIGWWVVIFRFYFSFLNFVSVLVTNRGAHQINPIQVFSRFNIFNPLILGIFFLYWLINSQKKILNKQTHIIYLRNCLLSITISHDGGTKQELDSSHVLDILYLRIYLYSVQILQYIRYSSYNMNREQKLRRKIKEKESKERKEDEDVLCFLYI